jgi:membrane protein DedA with SNARE-associated domain
MGSWLVQLIQDYGLLIIFVAMAAENACLPIPSEVVVPYGGVLVALGHTSMWAVISVSTAAALVGAGLVYAIGRWGGRPLALRYGHRIRLKPSHIDRAERWFARRGEPMVLYTRLLPIVRTFISLPAGIARMRWTRFLLYTVIGSAIWNSALAYLGWAFGANWDKLQAEFLHYTIIFLIVAAGLVACAIGWYVWRRGRRTAARFSAARSDAAKTGATQTGAMRTGAMQPDSSSTSLPGVEEAKGTN